MIDNTKKLYTLVQEPVLKLEVLINVFFVDVIKNAIYTHKKLYDRDGSYLNCKLSDQAGDWDCVAAVERLPALHFCVDFIFLSFGIMGFMSEL